MKSTSLVSHCAELSERRIKYGEEFRIIFGQPLKKFWESNLLGFDVIGFDEFINPPDGTSCAEAVEKRYGKRAVEVIRALITRSEP